MNEETNATPAQESDGKVTGSSTTKGAAKRSADELPDGSGNDAQRPMSLEDRERYDAG
ncbi:hypothetical protein [Paeniglutamicibacter sulfureus]|uniref:Nucleotide exchange factor GrpE n=1 Tax=Paeniglutamicibacter sulfureus TaxID=43666 RepID=A0ABU2BGE5_9MICC|nr:hypothetical protein [Paeniglutamicibacter sulfureus]MDO2933349.1 hypothetical protein [Paeniglutamicibacter sulfureus]MDR7357660.1 hypothetical protein [Paeniglutamicibacter sulfureus]